MAIEVPRLLVEFILLGPEDDRRQLQDSPILGDVWVEFAKNPGDRLELLITPYKEQAAGTVAYELSEYADIGQGNIAYLQGIVAARLTFEEVLRFVVPMTSWWNDPRIAKAIEGYASNPESMVADIAEILADADKWLNKNSEISMQDVEARKRYITLAGLILWAQQQKRTSKRPPTPKEQMARILQGRKIAAPIAKQLTRVFGKLGKVQKALVWTVSLNRRATPALTKSVPAVKADAARTLFTVDCREITWAVIDSGIDATHPAFLGRDGSESRVRRAFDFTKIRDIISLDNRNVERRKKRVDALLALNLKDRPKDKKEVDQRLQKLAEGAREGRSINWELVERLVEINPATFPTSHHGTHVAGIIGADRNGGQRVSAERKAGDSTSVPAAEPDVASDCGDGMCPDINIYDFRVLAPTLRETEFAIIAALQYIRYINERNSYTTIHGANLSLSIPHDVRNYACGRTPVCNECERLVNSGVVVVAAAGNRGYQNFETAEGLYEGYAAFSVTDPGNADGVITVGATHRYWPHTYGVSFFSSRGPTGDGRQKPDLVAPGERIRAPLPKNQWGDLDGTSMAAPHVSGAAAMLMARYSELIGQPRRIKEVLCRTATDLGREKAFQGHGMLDVLRAFQSI
jgi:serine protease AprX